jgi:multidrug efflux pump subunit AcrA (membrane-fusion protein)
MEMNELIKEVAVKHGIAVGKNDPLMVLCTINQRLLQESSAAQAKLLNQFREEIEMISNRWSEDTKAKAEKIINAALAASRNELATGIKEGVKAASEKMIRDLAENRVESIRQAKFAVKLNVIIAAIVIFFVAAAIVWAVKL